MQLKKNIFKQRITL